MAPSWRASVLTVSSREGNWLPVCQVQGLCWAVSRQVQVSAGEEFRVEPGELSAGTEEAAPVLRMCRPWTNHQPCHKSSTARKNAARQYRKAEKEEVFHKRKYHYRMSRILQNNRTNIWSHYMRNTVPFITWFKLCDKPSLREHSVFLTIQVRKVKYRKS